MVRPVATVVAGTQPWVNPHGFPRAKRGVGASPYDGHESGCWGGMRDNMGCGAGCGRGSSVGVGAVSGRNVPSESGARRSDTKVMYSYRISSSIC
jgi:hypothetical protein